MRPFFTQSLDRLRHILVACTQQHHRDLIPVFRPLLPPGGTAIDVGAHAGQFSKLLSDLVGPSGAVHAFEPSRYTRDILRTALKVTGRRNVMVHSQALSDQPGVLVLHTPLKRSGVRGYGLASLGGVDGRADRSSLTEEVSVQTLDDFVAGNKLRIDFIKADVEGWEAHLIRGGWTTVMTQKPALFLEIDHQLMLRAGESAEALVLRLGEAGYRIEKAGSWNPVSAYEGPGDYLFFSGPAI